MHHDALAQWEIVAKQQHLLYFYCKYIGVDNFLTNGVANLYLEIILTMYIVFDMSRCVPLCVLSAHSSYMTELSTKLYRSGMFEDVGRGAELPDSTKIFYYPFSNLAILAVFSSHCIDLTLETMVLIAAVLLLLEWVQFDKLNSSTGQFIHPRGGRFVSRREEWVISRLIDVS